MYKIFIEKYLTKQIYNNLFFLQTRYRQGIIKLGQGLKLVYYIDKKYVFFFLNEI